MSIELTTLVDKKLQGNSTVNFNSAMTASQMQTLIDAAPKNLNGYQLTFQFADGTYTVSSTLLFKNFYNGALNITGNPSDNTLSTTKAVALNGSSISGPVIEVYNCNVNFGQVNFLKIQVRDTNAASGVKVTESQYIDVQYGCIYATTNTYNMFGCFYVNGSMGYVGATYLSGLHVGIYSNLNSTVTSNANENVGTPCRYGLFAGSSAVVAKNGNQPTGCSVANESTSTGGVVR